MTEDTDLEALALLRAVLALGRRLRSERPEGAVTLAAISLLGTLGRLGPMPAVKLAVEERLQPQSLTRIVAGLEREGLIERRRYPDDQRALIITLTDKGKTVLTDDLCARQTWLRRAMQVVLSGEERTTLFAAARTMSRLAFHGDGNFDAEGT